MFHVKHKIVVVNTTIAELWQQYDLPALDHDQSTRLDVYATWLVNEAIPAGGLGPGEHHRIVERHVIDSLFFAVAAVEVGLASPNDALDIGAGVGLPCLPLAIVWPRTEVTALDRAGRRARLLRRAVRVLDLPNVEVEERDVADVRGAFELVTSRASLPPPVLRPHLARLASPDGGAIVAGSTEGSIEYDGYVTRRYDLKALDLTRWMLIMQRAEQ